MVTTVEATETGKAARARVRRSSHAQWDPAADRRSAVDLLEEECKTRVPELVPIRNARMATSPFAFFRGAAGIMTADLAATPVEGTQVQLCGDAHIMNFGGFASPDRKLVFDLNDFDETHRGPWEWDVKRLAASVAIALRERGSKKSDAVRATVGEYRRAMRRFAQMPALDVWYARVDEGALSAVLRSELGSAATRRFERSAAKARGKDSTRAFAKLAYEMNGAARIAADPPLITPVEDLAEHAQAARIGEFMDELVARYRETLPYERRVLLERFRYEHAARKVVGVGSVGTRAWVLLLVGRDHGEPLFLQAKEAGPSVLDPYVPAHEFDNEGRRVVEGQRLMQSSSDVFLGWLRAEGLDGQERDFYVRQLWDWKTSADVDSMPGRGLRVYGQLCGWTLARAHARSGDAQAIAAYMGSSDSFDVAVAEFAQTYADQNERDYRDFMDAIAAGRMSAAPSA